eukprot:3470031-Amphidinium_carterae.1
MVDRSAPFPSAKLEQSIASFFGSFEFGGDRSTTTSKVALYVTVGLSASERGSFNKELQRIYGSMLL